MASKELNLAPSTLSVQIRKLEEKLDVKLFNRKAKTLIFNANGQRLYQRAKVIFEEGARLIEQFSKDDVRGYPFKIGIEDTISYDLTTEFASLYWDLYVKYGTVNTIRQAGHEVLVDNLIQESIDWGISIVRSRRKSINYLEIGSFEVVFCCSKELFEKFINFKDILANIPFVESNWDKNLNQLVYNHLRKNEATPKEIIYSDHIEYIQKLCSRGRCVTYLPKNPLEDYKGLTTFQFSNPLKVSLYAIWKRGDEGLISIRKLQELANTTLANLPHRYEDVQLQLEASHVSEKLLE